MIRRLLFCLFLSGNALACTDAGLGEAVELVLQANPVLLAEQVEYREQTRQRDWSLKLSLDYPVIVSEPSGSDSGSSSGPSAGLALTIPLFDRKHDLKRVKAHSALQQKRDSILKAFLAEMKQLCMQGDQVRELDSLHSFYRDRLLYRKEQVKEGIEEPGALWNEAEQVQKTAHDQRREAGELITQRLTIARRFGGTEWKRLQA